MSTLVIWAISSVHYLNMGTVANGVQITEVVLYFDGDQWAVKLIIIDGFNGAASDRDCVCKSAVA